MRFAVPSRFDLKHKQWWRERAGPLFAVLIVAVVGTILLTESHAATPAIGKEAENGTSSGSANVLNDSSASNGRAVQFGASQGSGSTQPLQNIFANRVGFGANASGGAGGTVVHVTNDNDTGAGSLRAAVNGDSAKWVVFDGDYTIRLLSGVDVGANTTIDGRGHKVILTGCQTAGSITCANQSNGLQINDTHNVIVENIIVSGFGNTAKTDCCNDPWDAVEVQGSHDVWLDHLDITHNGDKGVSVQLGTTNLTVSWLHFYDQKQNFQIGDQASNDTAALQTVTSHHNFFDNTGYREPVLAYGKAHVYNNYFLHWQVYAVRSERTAQMYLENNIFEMGDDPTGSLVKPGGDGCNDSGSNCDTRLGDIKSVGNLLIGDVKMLTNEPDQVFIPSSVYSYTAQPADTTLKQAIIDGAGWRQTILPH